jgi:hypothetical protein
MGRLIDIDGAISHTNQLATGDIVIGDTTLFAGVPCRTCCSWRSS